MHWKLCNVCGAGSARCRCPVLIALLTVILFAVPCTVSAAVFTGTPFSGPAPLSVQFSDASPGSPSGWAWYFGDEAWTGTGWNLQSANPWTFPRAGHQSVVLLDGSILLIGGMDQSTNPPTDYTDTRRSTDKGVTWTIQSTDPGWLARSGHSCNVLPDGSILLTGGEKRVSIPLTLSFNDTWLSTDKGVTWALQSSAPAWPARGSHTSVTLPNGSIVLMGGRDNQSIYYNDTWRSADMGLTWSQVPAKAPWIARFGHTSVLLPDNSIVLMGGQDGAGTYYNDTWRSADMGLTWSQVSAKAPWIARMNHASVVMPDGSILLMGGSYWDSELNDVWRSADMGATWTRLATSAEWSVRSGHTAVMLPDASIVLAGGSARGIANPLLNTTWRLATANAAQNPAHSYTRTGTYSVTLQAYNADGWSRTTRANYITVTAPVTTAPAGSLSSGDSDRGSIPTPSLPQVVSVNIGGNSAAVSALVTGNGIRDLIITGTTRPGAGSGIPLPPGTVYQYIDLVPARYTSITGTTITFTVPQSWLDKYHLTPQDIVLYHYVNGAWIALPTTPGTSVNGIVTFTATSPGFSLFTIAGQPQAGAPAPDRQVTLPAERAGDPAPSETMHAVTQVPVATRTTAIPATEQAAGPGMPVAILALAGIVILAAGGFFARRWWIRRQNPALFEKDD